MSLAALLAALALSFPAGVASEDPLLDQALLSRLHMQELPVAGEFRLVFEPPPDGDATFASRLSGLLTPWLAALPERARAEVLEPGKLAAREDAAERAALVVFGRKGTFDNARRYAVRVTPATARTARWADPPAALAWWDASFARVPADVVRTPMLAEALGLWLERYDHRAPEERGAQRWLVEGLAGCLAAHGPEAAPPDLARCTPAPAVLARLPLGEPARLEAALLPLATLLAADRPDERAALAQERWDAAELEPWREGPEAYVTEQAALWVQFLLRAQDGRYREGFLTYLAQVWGGLDVGAEKLARELGVIDLTDLAAPFAAHLVECAAHAADPAPLADAPGAGLPHGELLPPTRGPRHVAAAALGFAVRGDLARALEALDAATADTSDSTGVLQAERDRLSSLVTARDAFLDGLPGAGRRLRLTLGGKSVAIEVERREGDTLVFSKSREGMDGIRVQDVSLSDLAASMDGRGGGAPEAVTLLRLLAGDPPARDTDPELVSLVREARAHAALSALAEQPTPTDAKGLAARLEAISRACGEYGDSDAVQAARPALRRHARELLEQSFGGEGLGQALHGKVQELGDGRLRVTYAFDKAAELEDFVRADGYLPDAIQNLPPTDVPATAAIKGGNLELSGDVALRHTLPMAAPLKVTYQLLYGRARPGAVRNGTVLIAVCDDGAGSYVGAWDLYDLDAIDLPTRKIELAREEGPRSITAAKAYPVELSHAGEEATLSVEGKIIRRVAVQNRTTGLLLLWAHGDVPLAISTLTVEGRVAPAAMEGVREGWVTRRLTDLGI